MILPTFLPVHPNLVYLFLVRRPACCMFAIWMSPTKLKQCRLLCTTPHHTALRTWTRTWTRTPALRMHPLCGRRDADEDADICFADQSPFLHLCCGRRRMDTDGWTQMDGRHPRCGEAQIM
jgi:hypothetical protein